MRILPHVVEPATAAKSSLSLQIHTCRCINGTFQKAAVRNHIHTAVTALVMCRTWYQVISCASVRLPTDLA